MRTLFVILIILLIIIGGAYYLYAYYYARRTGNNHFAIVSPTPLPTASPSTPSASVTPTIQRVILTDNGFSPSTITVKIGTTVVWTNRSSTDATVNSDPHPTHTDYPPLNLGTFSPGSSLSLMFNKPGTHGYHNHLQPSQRGTIIVQ